MSIHSYTRQEYEKDFLSVDAIMRSALERALDIRKFEIELYWKRAAYFWTFIGATLVGFTAIQVAKIEPASTKMDLLVLLANVGVVLSFGWLCVNKGSKHWQENWERHVDMLEDKINGPLYKVVMQKPRPAELHRRMVRLIVGPASLSVSKINQMISLFIVILWLVLLWHSVPDFDRDARIDWSYVVLCSITVLTCTAFVTVCRSDDAQCNDWATKRVAD